MGLNWYEMPLRSYDPTIARWNRIDPITHHGLSTYNAFGNNPVYYNDPSGGSHHEIREGRMVNSGDYRNDGRVSYNWNTGQYENSNGDAVSFGTALSSVGVSIDTNRNRGLSGISMLNRALAQFGLSASATDPKKKRTVTMMTEDLVAYGTDGDGEMPDWIDSTGISYSNVKTSILGLATSNSIYKELVNSIPKTKVVLGAFDDANLTNFSSQTNTLASYGIKKVYRITYVDKFVRAKNLSTGIGFSLTFLSISNDTYAYRNNVITKNRLISRTSSNVFGFGIGRLLGAGPGALFGVGAAAVEKGYDTFVDPNGPVQRNLNFNFTLPNINRGFNMFR